MTVNSFELDILMHYLKENVFCIMLDTVPEIYLHGSLKPLKMSVCYSPLYIPIKDGLF